MAIIPFETKIDFNNPRWNRDAWARIQGDMNAANERIGQCSGQIVAVRPAEALKPILGFEVFLATRLLPATWSDLEAAFYGFDRRGSAPLQSLRCPILLNRNETGIVSIRLSNTTDRALSPSVRGGV